MNKGLEAREEHSFALPYPKPFVHKAFSGVTGGCEGHFCSVLASSQDSPR